MPTLLENDTFRADLTIEGDKAVAVIEKKDPKSANTEFITADKVPLVAKDMIEIQTQVLQAAVVAEISHQSVSFIINIENMIGEVSGIKSKDLEALKWILSQVGSISVYGGPGSVNFLVQLYSLATRNKVGVFNDRETAEKSAWGKKEDIYILPKTKAK